MATQIIGAQYFLAVAENNLVLGCHQIMGAAGQQKKPNWRSCEYSVFCEVQELLKAGIYKVMLSRHGYLSKEYDLEKYREYAFKLVEDAKSRAKQQETINIGGNDVSVHSDNLLALCCSVVSNTPILVEDKDDLECVRLTANDSKNIMQQYVDTISRQNQRFCSLNKKILESSSSVEIQNALKKAGFKGYL